MVGAVQHAAELDDVPPGLIGQRTPAFMFMAAQQRAVCWTAGTASPGRTGVKDARLTANTANSIRARNFIGDTLTQSTIFERGSGIDARG